MTADNYVAPERLEMQGFVETCCNISISLLAVDEAHCISERGSDFRPSYLKICEYLKSKGVCATRYHAGLSNEDRKQNQEDFVYDSCNVMVATNALGMGINKSNVNYVIHYNMPTSIESYYQEAGRAGRDSEAAECIMLFSSSDIMLAKRLIQLGENKDEIVLKADYDRLELQ